MVLIYLDDDIFILFKDVAMQLKEEENYPKEMKARIR